MLDDTTRKPGDPAFRFDNRDALLRNVVENAEIPTFLTKADGEVVYANPAFRDLLGYGAKECIGLGIGNIVHPDDVAAARARKISLICGERARYQAEVRCLCKNGNVIWVLASPSVLLIAGRPICLTIQAVDIDRRKRAEEALAETESRWKFALESAGLGVWEHDFRTGHDFFLPTWKVIRGLDPDTEIHDGLETWMTRVHPDDRSRLLPEIRRHGAGDVGARSVEYRERHEDGHWMWILDRSRTVEWLADGTPARIIGTNTDITSLKSAEEKLQFVNTLLRTQMETSPDAILVVDASSRIISFNRRFSDMWGIPVELLEAEDDVPILSGVRTWMKDPAGFALRVQYRYDHPEEEGHDELETRDGRTIDHHTGVLRTPGGEYLGRVWFFRDITRRKRDEAQILRSARYDGLTGIANRAVFMEAVRHAISVAKHDGGGFAVLYLDLDQFKDVNDTLGHLAGDELLKAVAERLQQHTRDNDVVARFGGDEFAVMVADVTEPGDAAAFADKIIQAVSEPFLVHGNDIRTAASIGIALFGPEEPTPETMLSRADLALYRAKAEGPGVHRFFTEAMDSEVRTRVRLGSELREAITDGQLFLVYQPQVEIDTGQITGVEALVRWRHPTRGILGPNLFIPAAEKSGLIASLGQWVLREACRQSREWLDADISLKVTAVNLSTVQFKRSFELEADIVAILADTGLPPRKLELELTETVLMAASRDHNDVLQRLCERGIRLAIDDFGVGYSSLDYLRRFPVDRIKVAQEFVDSIATEPGSAAIVRAAIGLARELGINLVAEGVETPEQLELLKAWGCREARGFYFAEPLTAEVLTPLLARGRVSRERSDRAKTAA